MVDSCLAGAECGATGSGTRIYPYCMYWPFGNLFYLDGCFAQPRYSREGLGPSLKQCALPSLRSGWGVRWGSKWKELEEGREKELGLVCIMKKKIVCFLLKKLK